MWAEDSVVRVQAGDFAGTGFIFETEGETAFVVTNHHVIEDDNSYDVLVQNADTYEATLLGYDSDRDIAVLSICCSPDFFAIDWESGTEAEMGDEMVAVGYPRGSGGRVTATAGQLVYNAVGNALDLVSHNAPLNPGNSGGPLFSMNGEVVGVNVASSKLEDGVFYAVPYAVIREDVLEWKSRLVVLEAVSAPVALGYADMWVRLVDGEDQMEMQVDVAFDVDRFALTVFVDLEDFCNPNAFYGDEGYYKMSCTGPDYAHHQAVSVSAQVNRRDYTQGLRCERSEHSNAERTLFACTWR